MKITSMYKYEIAQMAGVSTKCLRQWLTMPEHKKALEKMGVKPRAHMLPPKAVKYIIELYGIVAE